MSGAVVQAAGKALPDRLGSLLDLGRQARLAESAAELEFLLVNETTRLAPFRQAALWSVSDGVMRLSGVVQLQTNAPYALWLEQVCQYLAGLPATADGLPQALAFSAADLPEALALGWQDWWPARALWLPLAQAPRPQGLLPGDAALLLVREEAWSPTDTALLGEWLATAWHARRALIKPAFKWRASWRSWWHAQAAQGRPWWKRPRPLLALAAAVVILFPVRQTVMAPGELVPRDPAVIRAPVDGVIERFHVQPNQLVQQGQPLFRFDEVVFQSRLDVALQTLMTAELEYRQTAQQALADSKSRAQLAMLMGRIEEKKAEAAYLQEQSARLEVLAPRDGVALIDDPSQWVGRPVSVGERVMRIAQVQETEVEAWVSLGDAIALPEGARISLFLGASPLSPVSARLRYMAFEAEPRPDGSMAYRVRATLDGDTAHRVGSKGTAKLYGGWVTLGYWLMRRPLAVARASLGV